MSSLPRATSARMRRADGRRLISGLATGLICLAVAIAAAACTPAATPLAEGGPADPAARVPGVGYRSTIAPYTSLRPSTPAPWRERSGADR
jgi:hypothetical protein